MTQCSSPEVCIFVLLSNIVCSRSTGTPTSLIFAQEPDLNQLHVLKDCNNHSLGHELVPIITMNNQLVLPEVLENVPELSLTTEQYHPAPIVANQTMQANLNTGVYTLPEEPELESDENLAI